MRPFAGQVLWNKTWGGTAAAVSLLPPLRTSPPKYLPAEKKKFCSAPPGKSLASKKSSVFHTRGISCDSAAFSFSASKTLRAKGTRPPVGPNKPLSPPMGKRPHESAKPPLLAPCGPLLAIQPHKLTHPPQTLETFQPPGAFLVSAKGGMPRPWATAPQKNQKGVMYRLSSLSTCFPAPAGSGKDWSEREGSPVWATAK